jgi:hypothetical protein
MMMTAFTDEDLSTTETDSIPADAAMVISALEAGDHSCEERRLTRRISYRTTTQIRLFRDGPTDPGRIVYTRDINRRGLGFVTSHRLPLGYGGIVRLPDERGEQRDVHCTLLRCREAAPGWFEGSVYFNRDQPQFDQ